MVFLIVVLVCISLLASEAELHFLKHHFFFRVLTRYLCVHLGEMSMTWLFSNFSYCSVFITALLIYNSHTVHFVIVRITAPQVA